MNGRFAWIVVVTSFWIVFPSSKVASTCRGEVPRPTKITKSIRRPVAIVATDRHLLVANQRSGTVSVVNRESRRLTDEFEVADQISDMRSHPGKADAFAVDSASAKLIVLRLDRGKLITQIIQNTPRDPVRLAVSAKSATVAISGRWSRSVQLIRFDRQFANVSSSQTVPLAFPPRELLFLEAQGKLLAADAFAGRLAIIDLENGKVEQLHSTRFHNIRGLALDPSRKTVLLTHQVLDQRAWADRDDVHWGILMTNTLTGVAIDDLLSDAAKPFQDAWVEQLGLVGDAAGDPGQVLLDERGRRAIALSGVDAILVNGLSYSQKFPVGRRPIALCFVGEELWIANHFADSLSVMDLRLGNVEQEIPLGPKAELASRDEGELLFFDAGLSHDNWMSCHSCHSDGHTIELLADTLGDGGYGAPKRIPSLLGVGATSPWAWDGKMPSLREQVKKSVRTTMHGGTLSNRKAEQLVAYLKSLDPPKSAIKPQTSLVIRGRQLFKTKGCVQCHQPPRYTSQEVYDVGLVDESGKGEFNPPSLLGVGQRRSFFHDGRAASVEEVVRKVRHQLDQPLSESESQALIAFLKSL